MSGHVPVGVLAGGVVTISVVAVAAANALKAEQRSRAAWRQFAADLDAECTGGWGSLRVETRGSKPALILDRVAGTAFPNVSTRETYTRMRLLREVTGSLSFFVCDASEAMQMGVSLIETLGPVAMAKARGRGQPIPDAVRELAGLHEVKTGLPTFDRRFILMGSDWEGVRALFREVDLQAAIPAGTHFTLTEGIEDVGDPAPNASPSTGALTLKIAGLVQDEARLRAAWRLLCQLDQQLT